MHFAEVFFIFFIVCYVLFFAVIVSTSVRKKNGINTPNTVDKLISEAKRAINSPNDAQPSEVSCENLYGHDHNDNGQRRLIKREKLEPGYVILNGVKRKISDLDD